MRWGYDFLWSGCCRPEPLTLTGDCIDVYRSNQL